MKEEIAVISAERKWVFNETSALTDRITGKDVFMNPVNFDREPQFVAIFVKGEKSIQVIAEVDQQRSDLRNGKVWMQNPIQVNIPIRFGKDKLEGIRYTTFRKLVSHKNADYL